jgi:hypothetical protein
MIKIENNRLVGKTTTNRQFLNGSPDVAGYQVEVDFTGADIAAVVDAAMDSGIITLRKRIKTKEQALALAKGITFAQMVGKQPEDPDTVAASLPVDQMSAEATADLIKRLQAKLKG